MKISISSVAAAVIVTASTASAQTSGPDQRWRPWLGCWSTVSGSTAKPVCVVPAAGTSAVDIVIVGDGKIASREHLDANGERRRSERDGCAGWESAQWSSDARRVYLQSEFVCPSGQTRSSSGLIAMSPQGEWLDLVGVTLGDNTGVRVLRHRIMGPTPTVPPEITAALEGTAPSFRDAAVRNSAGGAVETAQIAEASRQLKPQVVEAWLRESGQEFTVDAKRLKALAAANVPDRIIDVIVALAYPTAFAVRPSSTAPGLLTGDEPRGGADGFGFADANTLNCAPLSFSIYGWDTCSPFGNTSLDMPFGYRMSPSGFLYSRYGAGAIDYLGYGGLGYGAYGGGWYLASQPSVIVLNPGNTGAAQHGQVVNGRGYVEGNTGTSTAVPISSGSSSSGSSSGGSSGGSSGSSGATSSTSGAGDGGRTAVPR
ncbi:MAG: hypothetical protein ABI868_03420 [Acidobacteriota bacterium]